MDGVSHSSWTRALGVVCVFWLLVLMLCDIYSAAATALDRNSAFPSWEPFLGCALFVLPCAIIVSLFFLHGRLFRLGFYSVVGNIVLYFGFMIFESITSHATPVSRQAMWVVEVIWAMFFLAALFAALFLKIKAQAIYS